MLEKDIQVFKTRWFARFAKREGIEDRSLIEAIKRAERGLIDADLGSGLIKQRVARRGAGRSGGYRTIIAYRAKDLAIFLSGFAKSELDNMGPSELQSLRRIAADWLRADRTAIQENLEEGRLQEVENG